MGGVNSLTWFVLLLMSSVIHCLEKCPYAGDFISSVAHNVIVDFASLLFVVYLFLILWGGAGSWFIFWLWKFVVFFVVLCLCFLL